VEAAATVALSSAVVLGPCYKAAEKAVTSALAALGSSMGPAHRPIDRWDLESLPGMEVDLLVRDHIRYGGVDASGILAPDSRKLAGNIVGNGSLSGTQRWNRPAD